jgi:hypothetical protein
VIELMKTTEWFVVEDSGPCRWIVRHQLTEELAGVVVRTPAGYLLRDDQSRSIGSFPTLDLALAGLYEFV